MSRRGARLRACVAVRGRAGASGPRLGAGVPGDAARARHELLAQRQKGKHRRGMTSVLVKLDAAALASYAGGVPGLRATAPRSTGRPLDVKAPESQAYLRHFRRKQEAFQAACHSAIPGAVVTHSLPLIFGGVAMVVPDESVEDVAKLPGVERVYADELLQLDTDASPRFIGAPAVWNALGGRRARAKGSSWACSTRASGPSTRRSRTRTPRARPIAAPPGQLDRGRVPVRQRGRGRRRLRLQPQADRGPALHGHLRRRVRAAARRVPLGAGRQRARHAHGQHRGRQRAGRSQHLRRAPGPGLGHRTSGARGRLQGLRLSKAATRATRPRRCSRRSWTESTSSTSRSAAAPTRTPTPSSSRSWTPTTRVSSWRRRPATPAPAPTPPTIAARG